MVVYESLAGKTNAEMLANHQHNQKSKKGVIANTF